MAKEVNRGTGGPYPPELLAYVAGILDGEGYVSFCSHRVGKPKRFVMQVQMTDEGVVRFLHDTFGGGLSYKDRVKPHWKDLWRWQVTGEYAKEVYRLVERFLRIKNIDVDCPQPLMS